MCWASAAERWISGCCAFGCLVVLAVGCLPGVAAEPAAAYGGKSVADWLTMLKLDESKEQNKELQRRAAYALGQIGPAASAAVPALCEALDSESMEVRQHAVDALGRIGPAAKGGVPKIIEALQESLNDQHVHRLAAKSLGRIGPEAAAATTALTAALKSDDLVLRVEAAVALWKIAKHDAALVALTEVLRRDDTEGPYQAAMAVRELQADATRTTDALVAALKHRSPDVRRAAAQTLATFGPPVIEPVSRLLDDPAAPAEPAAFVLGAVLGQMRRTKFYDPQITKDELAAAAQPVLKSALPALIARLSDKRPEVRQAADRALAEAGLLSVRSLLQVLGGTNEAVRPAALDALVRCEKTMPDPGLASGGILFVKGRLMEPLQELLKHPAAPVRAAACRVFAEFPLGAVATPALPQLRDALRDEDTAVRRYAAKALERLKKEAGTE